MRRLGQPDVDTCGRRLLGPVGIGSARIQPVACFGPLPGATITSPRLTPVSTSRSAPLSHAIRAPLMSHKGVGVPTGCLAGPASGQRQRGKRGPGVRITSETLCALYPCRKRRNPSIAAVFKSSLANCRDCRAAVPGLSVPGAPLEARASHREGGDGAPPRGRRPTVVEVRTWVMGADVREQEGCGNVRSCR